MSGPPPIAVKHWHRSETPLRAISCREQVQQNARQKARLTYSMTSSAIARTPDGIVTPGALAVWEAGSASRTAAVNHGFVNRPNNSSLRPNASRFDERPPFLDFGLMENGKRFWRLLFRRRRFNALIAKSLANRVIGQGGYD